MFYPMLLLFHGRIVAIIPALFLLGIAGLIFTFLVRSKLTEQNNLSSGVLLLIIVAFGFLGLLFFGMFLDEFWYWVKYSF